MKEGTRVSYVIRRIPLDVDYDLPVCASIADGDEPQVTVDVFHARISGSAEAGTLKTASPSFFEVGSSGSRHCFGSAREAVQLLRQPLGLDDLEARDLESMLAHTTSKKHSKSHHLTSFKLDESFWEWAYETAGEVEVTPNEGDGLLVHATVWNETTLEPGGASGEWVFGEEALDPFDEDEFGGVRHRRGLPD